MIGFILFGFILFIVTWILFTNVMVWKEKEQFIAPWMKPFLYVVVAIAYIFDVVFNVIFGSIMFLELPKELTLSERLRRLLLIDDDWRWRLAYFLCRRFIEPWDQGHCGLGFKNDTK